jgi:uncharacterized protein YqgV (UPF0045/DUF77 family)
MTEVDGNFKELAGVSFSIHPMSDDFIEIIKGALNAVDTSEVTMKTDDVTTTIKGKLNHVFDVTKAIFIHAAKTKKHVAFQATFHMGCPGTPGQPTTLDLREGVLNKDKVIGIKQYAAAKFALYPIGGKDVMDLILKQVEAMKNYVTVTPVDFATRLDGEAADIFDGLEQVFKETVEAGPDSTIMTVSISANSPSHNDKETN